MKPLKSDKNDTAHMLVRAGLSAIPIIGGPATELFSHVVTPPLVKRRIEWMNRIAERLYEIEKEMEEFDLESLNQNELFITTVMQATVIAIKTHQEEKIVALQNAVINSAIGLDIAEQLQLIFLSYIDTFTPLHLKILKYFYNPVKWFQHQGILLSQSSKSIAHAMEEAIPELLEKRSIYEPILDELTTRGLIKNFQNEMSYQQPKNEILRARITPIGESFLKYITSHEELEEIQ